MATVKIDIAPLRPTAAFQNRTAAIEFREAQFPTTVASQPRFRLLNLEGGFIETGALAEMILPVSQGIRAGAYGNLALGVITSDEYERDAITAFAQMHEVPLFISNNVDHAFENPQPVGILTQADEDTFNWVCRLGGSVTSAEIARAKGIEPAAANNRLINLAKKGYVFRVPRSRREGDLFVAPCLPQHTQCEEFPASLPIESHEAEIQLPLEIRDSVIQLAREQSKTPQQVLGEAWKAYFSQNREALQKEFKKVGELIRSGDTEALVDYMIPDLDAQANEAEQHARGDKGGA